MRIRSPFSILHAAGITMLLSVCAYAAPPSNDIQPHAGMMRFPDVSAEYIVFVYADDLWLVPRTGGTATPLASPPGQESNPRFSTDGKTIGFVGNYDGNRDLYTLPTQGGVPKRITHHPAGEQLYDWTADGRLIFYTRGMGTYPRAAELWTVDANGGLPSKLPVPYGANGTISSDGRWLAYTPHTRDRRTWKRYRGGMATDIWLFDLKNKTSKKITDWEGTDSLPMWHGDKVYYLSDGGDEHRLNIWEYDTARDRRRQLTHFEKFDCKWPSIGPGPSGRGEVVFQQGTDLQLLDLGSGKTSIVQVSIPGARPKVRPMTHDVAKNLAAWGISSTGKRALLEARGDIWTVPAKHGGARNLTRTAGVGERYPSWSPDGRWVAYFSDASGEYELYITQSDGKGETRKLTDQGGTWRSSPIWSPDSKHISFVDKGGRFFLHTIESGDTKNFDTDPRSNATRRNWSHDSGWMAYTKSGDNLQSAVWLYDVRNDKTHQVTSGMFEDSWPTFDREGKYLFLASNRNWSSPVYQDVGSNWVYVNSDVLLCVPLRDDIASPFAAKSDDEEWGDEDEDEDDDEGDEKKGDKDKKGDADDDKKKSSDEEGKDDDDKDDKDDKDEEDEIEPLEIDIEGFERRAVPIPVKPGSFYNLCVNDKGHLIYTRGARPGGGGKPSVKLFDLEDEKKEEKTVIEEIGNVQISADGKKLLLAKTGGGGGFRSAASTPTLAIVDAAEKQKMDKPLKLSELKTVIDPREEWKQLVRDAWRLERDYFYDPNMHGVDWKGVYTRYSAMLDDCFSREDVSFVIREMIAELNVGHAYYFTVGGERQPNVPVGMLGCDFALENGAYRISKIYEGAAWDHDARGPLSRPGVDVKEGDYLLAVDGVPLDTSQDPWAAFVGLANRVVTLTVSDKSTRDDDAREVLIKTLSSESNLRYRAWIEKNRKHVADKTGGRVGYVYVPDTGINGQNNLVRQFYGQRDKAALIIDERWNGGGQIPTRFIELLNRPATNFWAVREGKDWIWPPDSLQGPKCMLINGLAGSGGDCFPYYFRQAGLGKLIGTRTWGGLVGLSGNPRLIDGAVCTVPTFAFYENDGTWGIEGHGVDADIEVIDDPAKMQNGADPQLDAAIALMLDELRQKPFRSPGRPEYPDRSGMGILERDK